MRTRVCIAMMSVVLLVSQGCSESSENKKSNNEIINNTSFVEDCSNGVDDNNNGSVDCEDILCAGKYPDCGNCGNGLLDDGEECDGQELGGAQCADDGFTGGDMLCLRNCKLSNLSCDGSAVECADAGASLTEAFNAVVPGYGSCTTTVRLDYTTYAILGFEYFCSDFGNVVSEEPEARTIAETDTGLGTGSLLAPYDSDVQLFVYYNESGEVGVVSGPIGHGVFGGTWGTTQAGGIT